MVLIVANRGVLAEAQNRLSHNHSAERNPGPHSLLVMVVAAVRAHVSVVHVHIVLLLLCLGCCRSRGACCAGCLSLGSI